MEVYDCIKKRRSVRKFEQKKVGKDILLDCVNAARLAPSSGNRQPLEFILVTRKLGKVFKHTHWAGHLDEGRPKKGERPTAYIVIISNKKINPKAEYDVGLAAENVALTALERGVASCVMGVEREGLRKTMKVPDGYEIELIVSLGYPKQKSIAEDMKEGTKYWLDDKGVMHVPKRRVEDVLHEEKF